MWIGYEFPFSFQFSSTFFTPCFSWSVSAYTFSPMLTFHLWIIPSINLDFGSTHFSHQGLGLQLIYLCFQIICILGGSLSLGCYFCMVRDLVMRYSIIPKTSIINKLLNPYHYLKWSSNPCFLYVSLYV